MRSITSSKFYGFILTWIVYAALACTAPSKAGEDSVRYPVLTFDRTEYRQPLDDPRMGFKRADGLPPVPVGLHAYIRYVELAENETKIDRLLRQCGKEGFIHALALRVKWSDILKVSKGNVSIQPEGIGQLIDKINAKCMKQYGTKLPVFLKFYFEHFPAQLCGPVLKESGGSMNKTLMLGRDNFYCYRIKGNSIPISTDKAYHSFLAKVMDGVGRWLEDYDPNGELIPMMSFIAPFMSSNQMRVPNNVRPGDFPPYGPSKLPHVDWSKEKHVQAFEEFAGLMGQQLHEGFMHRYWVFNYTYPGRFPLTSKEQKRVADLLAAAHPYGARGVLSKSESLCVNFNSRNNKFNPAQSRMPSIAAQRVTETFKNASWRKRMLRDGANSPYKTIVEDHLAHGWEIYRHFNYKFEQGVHQGRGMQTATMYPLDSMMDNTLYTRPQVKSGLQGTLWVEIKKEEAIRPEKLYRLDNGRPLAPWLHEYDRRVRESFLQAYKGLKK